MFIKKILPLLAIGALVWLGISQLTQLNRQPTPVAQAASVDYFLKIPDVEGESTDDAHPGEIEILSWGWGETNNPDQPVIIGRVPNNASLPQDFVFTKKTDKATPQLMQYCASGKHFDQVELHSRRAGEEQDYLTVIFYDATLGPFSEEGASGDVPTEEVAFNYSKVEYKYRPTLDDGSLGEPVVRGWDFVKKEPLEGTRTE